MISTHWDLDYCKDTREIAWSKDHDGSLACPKDTFWLLRLNKGGDLCGNEPGIPAIWKVTQRSRPCSRRVDQPTTPSPTLPLHHPADSKTCFKAPSPIKTQASCPLISVTTTLLCPFLHLHLQEAIVVPERLSTCHLWSREPSRPLQRDLPHSSPSYVLKANDPCLPNEFLLQKPRNTLYKHHRKNQSQRGSLEPRTSLQRGLMGLPILSA